MPETYRNLEKAIRRIYGNGTSIRVPSFLRFGSWIGGDRDGNPFVTPETTELAVRLHHREALREYLRITDLSHVLTHSRLLCQPTAAFIDGLDATRPPIQRCSAASANVFPTSPTGASSTSCATVCSETCEWSGAHGRDRRSRLTSMAVTTPNRSSLTTSIPSATRCIGHGDGIVANGQLKDLIRLAETFGFFLVHLDVRQESTRHTLAVAEF